MSLDIGPAQSDRAIYLAALDVADDRQRQAFLEQACAGDAERRREIERLLAAHHARGANPVDQAIEQFSPAETRGLEADASVELDISSHPVIDGYKLLEQIGKGGMGIVFMAQQNEPIRRRVALKLIKMGMDSREVISRFQAERQALAMMDHPNIARVLDAGTTGEGRPYFVMELVRGVPITEYCDSNRLSIDDRLRLFSDVCRAVQHAHQKGIIHRDLKPSNVMITLHDGTPVVKVIDFGVAKALNQELTERTLFTQFSQMIGTPLYMSPEQAEMSGLDIDTRSDIYSLGVLLYELLTGTTPFDKETLSKAGFDELRRIIREQEPLRPSQQISTLEAHLLSTVSSRRTAEPRQLSLSMTRELDWIAMKALEKDRNRRYESASAFAADVERHLADEPVQACPPSVGYRLWKTAQRNKVALITAAVVLVALLAGTGVSVWQAVRATKAERLAEERLELANERFESEQKARRDTEAQRKRAEENFRQAREAVDRYFTLVSESRLLDEPGLQPLRLELIEASLHFYEKFVTRRSDDPQVQLELAAVHLRLAQLYHLLGRWNDMISTLERGFALVEKMMQRQPAESQVYLPLAGFWHGGRGGQGQAFQAISDPSHALAVMQKGVGLWERLVKAHPTVWGFQSDLSKFYDQMEDQQAVLGQQEQALRSNERQIDIREKLVQRYPDVPKYKAELSYAYWALARFLRNSQPQQAEELFRRAITAQQQAALPYYRSNLAGQHYQFAQFLQQRHRPDDAIEHFRKAIGIYEKLTAEYPHISGYQSNLASSQRLLAELIRKHNTPEGAVTEYSRLIAKHPKSSTYYRYRGSVLRDQGEYERALEDLTTAIALLADDGDLRTYQSRVMLFVRMKQYDKAVADYDEYVKRSSNSAEAHFARGSFYLNTLKDYEKALADFDKSLDITPKSGYRYKRRALAHFHLRHYDKALADIAQAVKLTPNDGSNFYWIPPQLVATCPDEAFREGMLKLADKAVKQNDIAYVRIGRAGLLAAFGRHQQALADYNKAIEMEPKNPSWLGWRAAFFVKQGDWQEAANDFSKAISLKPDYYYTRYQYALASLAGGRRAAYRDACQQMLKRFAKSTDANEGHFTVWTCVLAAGAMDDYSQPIEIAEQLVKRDPASAFHRPALGAVLYRAGSFREALEHLNIAAESAKADLTSAAYAWYFLAMTQHRLGHADEAREWLAKADEQADRELNDAGSPAPWNRKLTLELLRKESEELLRTDAERLHELPVEAPEPSAATGQQTTDD